MQEISKEIYPFHGKYFDIDGLKYHYLDEGSGEPVVMLHGNPTWSIYYRELVKALRKNFRCIVPDHIGCGLSDKPDDSKYRYTFSKRFQDVENLLEGIGIKENITLIVHDWGGIIGTLFATRYPERIKKMVIFNTAGFRLPQTGKLPWELHFIRNTEQGAFLVREYNLFSFAASFFCCARKMMPSEIRKAYRAPYDTWENRIATLRFVQDIPLIEGDPGYNLLLEIENNLANLKEIPKLICWGEKDFVFDKHFLNEWIHYFPDSEVYSFPDCGHYILEDAKEEIIPLVEKFMGTP